MSQTVAELREELNETGSVTIKDTIIVEDNFHYKIHIVNEEGRLNPPLESKAELTNADLQTYLSAIEIVHEWDENGYSDINGWRHEKLNGHDFWKTPEGRSVRLTQRSHIAFTTSKIGELIVGDSLTGASSVPKKVKLGIAIFLHSTPAREFDYQYAKYKSIKENLEEIRGIGQKTSLEIAGKGCETYQDACRSVKNANIPPQYYGDTRKELRNRADSDDSLIDPEVQQKYSDVIVVNAI